MLSLSDAQLQIIWDALRQLPTEEQRSVFLKLIEQQLRPSTVDVRDAVTRAARAVTSDVGP